MARSLVDQDARDIDHRRQVQQIDEHELAARTEPAQPARYAVHECHGVCCGTARAGGWPGLPTVVSECYNVVQFPRHFGASGLYESAAVFKNQRD